MGQNPLRELNKLGQSVWYDYIRRGEILSGDLKRLIDEDGLSGVTSNPSIFEKAIAGSKDYDEAIRKLVDNGQQAPQIFESLAVEDIQMAADLFRPTYDATDGRDGFVSIEVSPTLAYDTAGTIAEVRRLHREVNRPNVMIKIPGTEEGLPAIEEMLAEGININITLLFAVERYVEVANAYVTALERRAREGKAIARVASVASFFVSRIDTLVDQQLNAKLQSAQTPAEREKIEALLGKVAVVNAKVAYQEFKEIFSSARFQALAQTGARMQRVLWASTSTKNPKYSDILYVEKLIGRDTINTMPAATMAAFRDHGKARATLEEGVEESRRALAQLAEAGINLREVTRKLEDDGVEAFARDFAKLLKCIAEKRERILEARNDRWAIAPGKLGSAIDATLAKVEEEKFSRRLWDRDASLWNAEPQHQQVIRNALGWLTVSHAMLEHVDEVLNFVEEAKTAGFKQAVLLGMGGSSLCPDVCRATFGAAPGYLDLQVLDSTVPASILRVEKPLDLAHTLFLVSSKSGETTETLCFFKYFYDRVRSVKGDGAGENFVAITDPGTSLEKLAGEKKFRRVFHGHPDIGGRYSALSNFGMAPAALMGVDVRALLDLAERMVHACGCCVSPRVNPGVALGVLLGEAARAGRDKVTFVISPGIETFADWAEQLIAESTGKEGKGLVPVAGEELGNPAVYGNDRVFVYLRLSSQGDQETEQKLKALEDAGHPVVRIEFPTKLDLGEEFFRWEIAVATAGALFGINAFDQPNVQESKDNTNALLTQFRSQGKLSEKTPALRDAGGIELYCNAATWESIGKTNQLYGRPTNSMSEYLAGFLNQARPGDYVALMAYVERSREHEALLQSIRRRIRDGLCVATTLGYGPRFLHSTGQLHKGGPNTGLFIQITADDPQDVAIPGEPYTFSVLKHAQALGDLRSLESKNRRVIRFHLGKDITAGLSTLLKTVEGISKQAPRATVR